MSGRPTGIRKGLGFFQAGLMVYFTLAPLIRANPAGENVAAGSATFDRTASTLTINTSDRVIINWQDFSIAVGETTKFVQPSATSAALNRVVSGNPSSIYGTLTANGQIFLINPNGVLVGGGAVINTAGFVASTLDIGNSQFLAGGDLHFTGDSNARLENRGSINALGGDIILIAREVENSGSLNAPDGTVGLAAGHDVLLTQTGDERIFVRPTAHAGGSGTGVLNSGTIQAARAELKAHGNLYALAINNSGVVRANGSVTKNGRVYLTGTGGSLVNSGTLSAKNHDDTGGEIDVAAQNVTLTKQSVVDASGVDGGKIVVYSDGLTVVDGVVAAQGFNGGFVETSGASLEVLSMPDISGSGGYGGEWLIDPVNVIINAALAAAITAQLNLGNNVTVTTNGAGADAGNINVNASIDKTAGGPSRLRMRAHNDLIFAGGITIRSLGTTANRLTIELEADQDNNGAGMLVLDDTQFSSKGANITFEGFGVSSTGGTVNATGAGGIQGDILVNGKDGSINLVGEMETDSTANDAITLRNASTVNFGNLEALLGTIRIGVAADVTGAVTQNPASMLRASQLRISTTGSVSLKNGGNNIETLAAAVGGDFSFRDSNGFTIGSINGVHGLRTTGGLISLVMDGGLVVNNSAGTDIEATNVIDLIADNLTLNGTVSGPRVTLRPYNPGVLINLGGADGAGQLGLTSAEINRITTPLLIVGNTLSGNITVSAPIAPTGTGVLSLRTGGAVIDGNVAGTDVTVGSLAIRSSTGIGSGNPLELAVTTLAFNNTTSGSVQIANTGPLTIGAVDGLLASANTGGAISVAAASPLVFAANTTSAGHLTATAGDTPGAGDNLTVNGGVTVRSTGGNVTLNAGDNTLINGIVRSDTGNSAVITGNNFVNNGTVQAPAGNVIIVVDNDFPAAPDFGPGTLTNNGVLAAGGQLLLFAVQPTQVFPDPSALVPPGQWVWSTYFGGPVPAAGNVLAFKIANPSPPAGGGPGGAALNALLLAFSDTYDRYYRSPKLPPNPADYGIYYFTPQNLDAAPPNLGEVDLGLDPAPPGGFGQPGLKKKLKVLTGDTSFEAFANEAPPIPF